MKVLVREPIARGGHGAPPAALRRRRRRRLRPGGGDRRTTRRSSSAPRRKLTAELIERAERLKVIGRAGVGVDNVDVAAATRRGIVVANAPDSTVVSAAEQTIGLMVALARNIPQAHAALKQGRWERERWAGVELAGQDARCDRLRPDRPPGRASRARSGHAGRRARSVRRATSGSASSASSEPTRSTSVLASADVVSLHSPLTPETERMIDAEAIGRMKDGARLVNAARGAARRRAGAGRSDPLRKAGRGRARRVRCRAVRR